MAAVCHRGRATRTAAEPSVCDAVGTCGIWHTQAATIQCVVSCAALVFVRQRFASEVLRHRMQQYTPAPAPMHPQTLLCGYAAAEHNMQTTGTQKQDSDESLHSVHLHAQSLNDETCMVPRRTSACSSHQSTVPQLRPPPTAPSPQHPHRSPGMQHVRLSVAHGAKVPATRQGLAFSLQHDLCCHRCARRRSERWRCPSPTSPP